MKEKINENKHIRADGKAYFGGKIFGISQQIEMSE